MKIYKSIIVAYNQKGVIGNKGFLPWRDKEDLQRFKEYTTGHPVVMGRKTHESIGKLLPNRPNIIISRNKDYIPLGLPAYTATSLDAAFRIGEDECNRLGVQEIFIIGGGEIYRQALYKCDTMYISEFNNSFDGDVFFPSFDENSWEENFHEKEETHLFRMLEKIQ